MADTEWDNLGTLAEKPADGDTFTLLDVSDTAMSAQGTVKQCEAANVLAINSLRNATANGYLETDSYEQVFNATNLGINQFSFQFQAQGNRVLGIGASGNPYDGYLEILGKQAIIGPEQLDVGLGGITTSLKLSSSAIGFFGGSPTSQPAAIADATDATDVITQCNAILAALRALGLIAT